MDLAKLIDICRDLYKRYMPVMYAYPGHKDTEPKTRVCRRCGQGFIAFTSLFHTQKTLWVEAGDINDPWCNCQSRNKKDEARRQTLRNRANDKGRSDHRVYLAALRLIENSPYYRCPPHRLVDGDNTTGRWPGLDLIPVFRDWTSVNNRVLIYGRSNTYKTSIAFRLMYRAIMGRQSARSAPATLTVIDVDLNTPLQKWPRLFGFKLSMEEFKQKLLDKGVVLTIIDYHALSKSELDDTLREIVRGEGEHHLLIDSASALYPKEFNHSYDATAVVARDIMDKFNGLCIATACTTGPYTPVVRLGVRDYVTSIEGGSPLADLFELHLQTRDVRSMALTPSVEITQGNKQFRCQVAVFEVTAFSGNEGNLENDDS